MGNVVFLGVEGSGKTTLAMALARAFARRAGEAGSGMVLITLLGVVVLRQHLDLAAIIGLMLIVAGVLVLHLGSKTAIH